MNAGPLPILTYHSLDRSGSVLSVAPDHFAWTMRTLHAAGWRTVDLAACARRVSPSSPGPLPPGEREAKPFIVCFDDGFANNEDAAAVLAECGFTATVFVVSRYVGRDNAWPTQPAGAPILPLMTWARMRELAGVFRFQPHTASHPFLSRLPDDRIAAELAECDAAVDDQLGVRAEVFAYPYGDLNLAARTLVKRRYSAAVGTRLAVAGRRSDRWNLERVDAFYLHRPQVERLAAGTLGPELLVRRLMRAVRRFDDRPDEAVAASRSPRGTSPRPPGGEGLGVREPSVQHPTPSPGLRPPSPPRGRGALSFATPCCRADPVATPDGHRCPRCGATYPTVAGIPDWRTRSDRYLSLEADRAKGLRLAEKAATTDLIGTAEFYYDITDDVDAPRRRIYMHHIRQAERRGAEILDGLSARPGGGLRPGMRVLEIGAGTGGLAAAAARRGLDVTAGDIAFRWTVVAARRMADAGLAVPLISFAAEAIPFADGQFDVVIANGVIEHCQDHAAVAAEARRVLRPGGVFLIVSPNRFAPTPEPHVGVWGVGFLPRAWMDAYVRAVRGIPYRWLRVFSAGELRRLLTRAGFASVTVRAAPIPPSRAEDFGPAVRRIVPWYNRLAADRLTGPLLTPVGPLLWAEAVARGDGSSAIRGPVGLFGSGGDR
mgnify:CR=1 FL=1